MEHHMGEEKIEQNIERVYIFLFHTLGCGKEDAKKIVKGVLQKQGISLGIEIESDRK